MPEASGDQPVMMEREVFELMAAHEDRHWWFVGRRAVIRALLDRITLAPDASILEAGCGTGGNLYLLEERGSVSAFEPSDDARDLLRQKDPHRVIEDGELPARLPFPQSSFDLVVALDVLEHIADDRKALLALVGLTRPGGFLLLTVPAHPALWGSHDLRLHHVRRYARRDLFALIEATPVDVVSFTAFNVLLAPIAVVLRLCERYVGTHIGNQERMPPSVVNRVFAGLFAAERHLIRRRNLPWGLSYAVILQRVET